MHSYKDQIREYKLQLIEKNAKLQELESECASLKRNNVIQAVELQVYELYTVHNFPDFCTKELHDHISGIEKQTQALQSQQFPPLPPLGIIQEVPFDDMLEEDDKLKAMILADEALGKAQQEITMLKKNDDQRKELEYLYMMAQDEISQLRKEMQLYQNNYQRSESNDAVVLELQSLKMRHSALLEEFNTAKEQVSREAMLISYLEDQASEIERLRASNLSLEYSKQKLEELLEIGQQNYDMYASSRKMTEQAQGGSVLLTGSCNYCVGLSLFDAKEFESCSTLQEIADIESVMSQILQDNFSSADEPSARMKNMDIEPRLSSCSERLKNLAGAFKQTLSGICADQNSAAKSASNDGTLSIKNHPLESALEIEKLLVQIHDLREENDKIKAQLEQKSFAYMESQNSLAAAQNHLHVLMSKYESSSATSPSAQSPQSPSPESPLMPQELQASEGLDEAARSRESKEDTVGRGRCVQRFRTIATHWSVSLPHPHAAVLRVWQQNTRRGCSSLWCLRRELWPKSWKRWPMGSQPERSRAAGPRGEAFFGKLSQGLHDCQMSLAKMEGKWKAAQSRITSLEKEIQMKNTELFTAAEEAKRARQNLLSRGISATLKNEIQECNQRLADHRKEIEQWYSNFDENYNKCKDDLKEKEEELSKVASEISDLKEALSLKEAAMNQKEHKMGASPTLPGSPSPFLTGILADQLKTQKDRTMKAELRASQAEEQLASLFAEHSSEFRSMDELNLRYSQLKEHSLELQAELSSRQIELAVTIEKKDSAISSLQAMVL
eukprot:752665-Hanusia_phi.AAC.3